MILLIILMLLCPVQTSNNDTGPLTINYMQPSMIEEVPVIMPEPLIFSIEVNNEVEVRSFDEPKEPEPKEIFYKEMELTAYIATGNPCADGSRPQVWYTAACNDPYLWHKTVRIEGLGDFYICDTGGMSSNVIDLFVGSYDEAINFGRQVRRVYIYE